MRSLKPVEKLVELRDRFAITARKFDSGNYAAAF
jgi:hypothetical protein